MTASVSDMNPYTGCAAHAVPPLCDTKSAAKYVKKMSTWKVNNSLIIKKYKLNLTACHNTDIVF